MSQDKIDMRRLLVVATLHFLALVDILESTGKQSSPWHRSPVGSTDDEQRGKLSERKRSIRLCSQII